MRGGEESVPLDHFSNCSDLVFNEGEFLSRSGIDLYLLGIPPSEPYGSVARIYRFVYNLTDGLLVLDTLGNIYHTASPTPGTPILSIPAMTDFAYYSINGRAFITPNNGITGLQNQFLYIYQGDGTLARKAGGKWPIGPNGFAAALSGTAGHTEVGIHVFAITYVTNTGFETSPGPSDDSISPNKMYYFATATADGAHAIDLTNIPVSPDSFVTTRNIYASVSIDPTLYTGDVTQYELFLIGGAELMDNTTTSTTVDFYDAELLQSSDDLFDLFSEIPAGVNITLFNNRMVLPGIYGDPTSITTAGLISTAYVSNPGQPEAVNMVSGLIVDPLDGNALTNATGFRGTLYLFKQTGTNAYNDNGDVPSSWPLTVIDEGIGASVHGIATVLDSNNVNIDSLVLVDYSGIMYFNGIYIRPELSFKIRDLWLALARASFQNIQILNDSLNQYLYITLPTNQLLFGDYSENLDPIKIKWCPWTFANQVSTIALINTDQLVIGSRASN